MSEGIHPEGHYASREQRDIPFDPSQSHSDTPSYLSNLIDLSHKYFEEKHFGSKTVRAIAKPNLREGTVSTSSEPESHQFSEMSARGSIVIGQLDGYAWQSKMQGVKGALKDAINGRLGNTSIPSSLSKVPAGEVLRGVHIEYPGQSSPPTPSSIPHPSGDKLTRPGSQVDASSHAPNAREQGTRPETEKISSQDLSSSPHRASEGEGRSEQEKPSADQPVSPHTLASEIQRISDDELHWLRVIRYRASLALQNEESYLRARKAELRDIEEVSIKQHKENSRYHIYLKKRIEELNKEINKTNEKINILKVKSEEAEKNYQEAKKIREMERAYNLIAGMPENVMSLYSRDEIIRGAEKISTYFLKHWKGIPDSVRDELLQSDAGRHALSIAYLFNVKVEYGEMHSERAVGEYDSKDNKARILISQPLDDIGPVIIHEMGHAEYKNRGWTADIRWRAAIRQDDHNTYVDEGVAEEVYCKYKAIEHCLVVGKTVGWVKEYKSAYDDAIARHKSQNPFATTSELNTIGQIAGIQEIHKIVLAQDFYYPFYEKAWNDAHPQK